MHPNTQNNKNTIEPQQVHIQLKTKKSQQAKVIKRNQCEVVEVVVPLEEPSSSSSSKTTFVTSSKRVEMAPEVARHKRHLRCAHHIQHHLSRPRGVRASEYKNLRQAVPSLRRQRDVGKIEVVTEAARYIDHLHKTLIERFILCGIPDSLKDILGTDDANELTSQHIKNLVTQSASEAATSRRQQRRQPAVASRSASSDQQTQPQRPVAAISAHGRSVTQRRARPQLRNVRPTAQLTAVRRKSLPLVVRPTEEKPGRPLP